MSERTLAAIATFAAARLPFYVVKGSVLAHRVYGDPHLRRFADVDPVVRQADMPRAEAILTSSAIARAASRASSTRRRHRRRARSPRR
jgi:hypothetical protein